MQSRSAPVRRAARDGCAPEEVIHEYLRRVHANLVSESDGHRIEGDGIEIQKVTVHDSIGREVSVIRPGDSLTVRVQYHAARPIASPQFSIAISDPTLGALALASMLVDGEDPGTIYGDGCLECTFPNVPFRPRTYDVVARSVKDSDG